MGTAKKKESALSKALRRAAKERNLSVDGLRIKLGLGGGVYYGLLLGNPIKSVEVIAKLKQGGIPIPSGSIAPEVAATLSSAA